MRLGRLIRSFGLPMILLGLLAACGSTSFGVHDSFGLPGSIGGVCAAYFTIDNPTDQSDVLIGVSSDIAEATEIHGIRTTNGLIEMYPLPQVEIGTRQQVKFEPGGLHVMFVNLKRELKPGDAFPLTLHFRQRGSITIQVTVKEL